MKYLSRLFVALTAVVGSLQVCAEESTTERIDCGAIVDQTVKELGVGAASWWSEDVEKMAGMAAMTACFKATAAYSVTSARDSGEGVSETSSAKAGSSSGLSFRPLSGSASKKPYERARARKQPE